MSFLGILEFPTMSSSGLTRGSHQISVIGGGQSDKSNLVQGLINEIASVALLPRNDEF